MHTASRTLNLGILAHVDAGKTSLTERLLYAAGVIGEIGSVDAGNTLTDSLEMERRRGITIKSAVVNFPLGSGGSALSVNLIDTPGHPDFIAEVERVLGVLDGAVLVVSAVEGVQPQTRVLMRTLKRLAIPTLVFINKVDRRGADDARVLREVRRALDVPVVPMGRVVADLGAASAGVAAFAPDDTAFTQGLLDVLTTHDDALLGAYLADERSVPHERLRSALVAQTRSGRVHPVYVGSAITGAGIADLVEGIERLLPAERADARAPLSARVFKVERGGGGERIAYARIFSGRLAVRDRVPVAGAGAGARPKVTDLAVFDRGAAVRAPVARAGQIAVLHGLSRVRIGDVLGQEPDGRPYGRVFAAPSLETVVVPADPADRGALHHALTQLAEQDPLIGLRRDPDGPELSVSLYGEVQKEVLAAALAQEYGITVSFRGTTPICVERVTGTGAAHEIIDQEGNRLLATVGLRVEPARVGGGIAFRREVELGSLPPGYMRAVEETVRATLGRGPFGWQVPDCTVTMTHSGFCSIRSTAGEFRALTRLVLMSALRRAGTVVHEPVHRFRLDFPQDAHAAVALALARHRAQPEPPVARGDAYVVEGLLPADRVHGLGRELPALTSGEGVLETAFSHYRLAPVQRARAGTDRGARATGSDPS
ncbi:GTP-binding protein [Streptomyces sp. NPDC051555]|uniref:GTP-binding protein n=1 Tax=Streptomyces sp. NPDC051555 TaxID=3365657 RepID=UPI0037A391EE